MLIIAGRQDMADILAAPGADLRVLLFPVNLKAVIQKLGKIVLRNSRGPFDARSVPEQVRKSSNVEWYALMRSTGLSSLHLRLFLYLPRLQPDCIRAGPSDRSNRWTRRAVHRNATYQTDTQSLPVGYANPGYPRHT